MRLTSIRRRRASGSVRSNGSAIRMPALRTRRPTGPRGARSPRPPRRRRLVGHVRGQAEDAVDLAAAEVARRDARSEVAQRLGGARPMPRAPPVTNATRPSMPSSHHAATATRWASTYSRVELPAETRRLGQLEHAVDERRPVRDEVPPDRVAVGVEALDDGPVRDRGDQVRGDLRAPRGGPSRRRTSTRSRPPAAIPVGPPTTTRRSCRCRSRPRP